MPTRQLIFLAIVSLLLSSFPAIAADPTAKEIDALIQKLGSRSFRERESAQKELSQFGDDILPQLRKAAAGASDAEIRDRLQRIIKVQEDKLFKPVKSVRAYCKYFVNSALSPDGKILVTVCENGDVLFWDASAGKVVREEKLGTKISSVRFSPDGRMLAFEAGDELLLLDALTGKKVREFQAHVGGGGLQDFNWSADGKQMVSAGYNDYRLRVWDIAAGKEIKSFPCKKRVDGVAISPDGKTIALGFFNNEASLWDVASGKVIREFEKHGNSVRSLDFSHDGKTVATGSDDHMIRIFDVESGKVLFRLDGHEGNIISVRFSMDGKRLLSGSEDQTMILWDASTGGRIHIYRDHSKFVSNIGISADGRAAMSASWDGVVNLWRLPK